MLSIKIHNWQGNVLASWLSQQRKTGPIDHRSLEKKLVPTRSHHGCREIWQICQTLLHYHPFSSERGSLLSVVWSDCRPHFFKRKLLRQRSVPGKNTSHLWLQWITLTSTWTSGGGGVHHIQATAGCHTCATGMMWHREGIQNRPIFP